VREERSPFRDITEQYRLGRTVVTSGRPSGGA